MRNQAWANYIKEKRRLKHLTRRKLAELAKIDPSYVTLIERDGYIPRRDKVLEIAKALEVENNQILLMAGYAPEGIQVKEFLQKIDSMKFEQTFDEEMLLVLKEISALPPKEQKKVAQMITAYVNVIKEKTS
ncbi:MAG: helix-turn-helix transcriptional regulator [Candidatus Eremiobacteraeota bacterium]|nr:helix-turn-helix transcriptional regulator [Candidatus Eremiobacteraeota bacterium]